MLLLSTDLDLSADSRFWSMKPRIVFLGPLPPPYMGPSIATQIILNSRLKERFDLIHLDTSDHRDLSRLGSLDFKNVFLAIKHYLQLLWLGVTERPQIVYVPISQTTVGYLRDVGFIVISKILGRIVICHLRGSNFKNWYTCSSSLVRFLVRRVHALVDAQIVLGESLAYLFDNLVTSDRIFVVPNGRDYHDNGQLDRNGASRPARLLYLSNFKQSKGVLETLQAIPAVQVCCPQVEFVFAGHWRDRETKRAFQALAEQCSKHPIVLEGSLANESKDELLSTSDIFVFPPNQSEGHPWVIVEALAHGLPVITTDVGCISESVIDGYNGFIVPKRNPGAIAEKIKLLIEDEDLRTRMTKNARAHYERFFTEEKMVENFTRCFEAVLNDKDA